MFRMIATFCRLRYVGVPLREDFGLDEMRCSLQWKPTGRQ